MAIDVTRIRQDFPILKLKVNGHPLVFFDNAATSQKPQSVIDGIKYFYENLNANPMRSIHYLAEKATEAYTEAREKVARFINASPEEIVFVRNATEAINLVSFSFPFKSGDVVSTTYLEHHSNLLPWLNLGRFGVKTDIADTDANFDLNMDYYRSLPNETRMVAVTHQSNVTGTINDVKTITQLAHEQGAHALIDAAQSVPHIPIDVKDIGADFVVFSGHKMLGPMGIGVLYMKKEASAILRPFLTGGEMINSVKLSDVRYAEAPALFEAGTQNVEGAYGLGLAIDYLNSVGMGEIERYEKGLTDYLYGGLKDIKGVSVYSGKSRVRGPILSFNVEGLHSHDVAFLLDKKGIAIRSGFHCAQPFIEDKLGSKGTARASLYLYNTKEEVDIFVSAVKEISSKYG